MKYGKNISERTTKNIINNRINIFENIAKGHGNFCRVTALKNNKLDEKMKEWIEMIELKGGFISDALIIRKAGGVVKEFNISDLKISPGWIEKIKSRNNFKMRILDGEGFIVENKDDIE